MSAPLISETYHNKKQSVPLNSLYMLEEQVLFWHPRDKQYTCVIHKGVARFSQTRIAPNFVKILNYKFKAFLFVPLVQPTKDWNFIGTKLASILIV